jgi:hypothetical protein
VATLADPEVPDMYYARRRLGAMIETLTAFAIGHAVGRVVEAMRRIDGSLAKPMADAMAAVKPAVESMLVPNTYLADAETRPIVDTFAGLLHQRIGVAARHARLLLRAVAEVIGSNGHAFANALELLVKDSTGAFAFADQLAIGWRFLLAVIGDLPDPALPDEPRWQRGRALWSAWSRKIRGVKIEQREFILRVA